MKHAKILSFYKKLLSVLFVLAIMLAPIRRGFAVESKTDGKTNDKSIEEIFEEAKTKKQMTIEEFREARDALRIKYRPFRDWFGKIEQIDRLYYLINFENCMDILDDLSKEGIGIEIRYPMLSAGLVELGFVYHIFDLARFTETGKPQGDFTDFFYDASAEELEFVKKMDDLLTEIQMEVRKQGSAMKPKSPEKMKALLQEVIVLVESEEHPLHIRVFILEVFQVLRTSIEHYLRVNAITHSYLEGVEKFINLEESCSNDYVLLDGIELNKNSDSVVEVALYCYEMLHNYSIRMADEMRKIDNYYRTLHNINW